MEIHATTCPGCGCHQSKVIETRWVKFRENEIKMRVRLCRYCGKTFRTKEIVETEIKLPADNRSKQIIPDQPVVPFPE